MTEPEEPVPAPGLAEKKAGAQTPEVVPPVRGQRPAIEKARREDLIVQWRSEALDLLPITSAVVSAFIGRSSLSCSQRSGEPSHLRPLQAAECERGMNVDLV
jgi:hypothetical protein